MKVAIRQPYFGAWKNYGWTKGVWGIGLKLKEVLKAGLSKEKITITIGSNPQEYQITAKKALIYGNIYHARFDTKLLVVPLDKFEKI